MGAWLRAGQRALRRSPPVTLGVVLCLGFGIGLSVTLFNLVNAVLLQPPQGVADADELAYIYASRNGAGRFAVSYPVYTYYREHSSAFSHLMAYSTRVVSFREVDGGAGSAPEEVLAVLASSNYFDGLGVVPVAGHLFPGTDDRIADADGAAVISERLWRRRFGGRLDAIGRFVRLNGRSFEILGVAPSTFTGAQPGVVADVWVPLMTAQALIGGDDSLRDTNEWLQAIGRLTPQHDVASAQANLSVLALQLQDTFFENEAVRGVVVQRAVGIPPPFDSLASMFLGALNVIAWVVLIVACVNAAALLLMQAVERRGEVAICLALGASRGRILRAQVSDSLVLAISAGVLGFFSVFLMNPVLASWIPPDFPIGFDFRPAGRTVGVAVLLSLIAGLVFGLGPAVRATTVQAAPVLASGDVAMTMTRRSRVLDTFLFVQVAMCTAVLAAGALFMKSVLDSSDMNPGFAISDVHVVTFRPSLLHYDSEQTAAFYLELTDRVRSVPGVASVTFARFVPFGLISDQIGIRPEPQGVETSEQPRVRVRYNIVARGYFDTMGIPVVRGTSFDADDGGVVIDETLARTMFPNEDPLGRIVVVDVAGASASWELRGIRNLAAPGSLRKASCICPSLAIPRRSSSCTSVLAPTAARCWRPSDKRRDRSMPTSTKRDVGCKPRVVPSAIASTPQNVDECLCSRHAGRKLQRARLRDRIRSRSKSRDTRRTWQELRRCRRQPLQIPRASAVA